MTWWPGWNSIEWTDFWSNFYFWFGILALLLLGVSEIISHRYTQRKDELVAIAEVATKQKHDAEVTAMHGQLTAAHEKLFHLSASRLLSEAQLHEMKVNLENCPMTGAVIILPVWSKPEIVSFAAQLASVVPKHTNNGAGALLLRPVNLMGYPSGVTLRYGAENAMGTNFAKEFARLLNAEGIVATAVSGPGNDSNIQVSIGEIP